MRMSSLVPFSFMVRKPAALEANSGKGKMAGLCNGKYRRNCLHRYGGRRIVTSTPEGSRNTKSQARPFLLPCN